MEYYCNIYCNPRQDYFIKVDQLFQNESNEGKGVYNFTGLGSEALIRGEKMPTENTKL